MNTTMADGAHDRLDAQIAEALFGQPGMSKMDVANRVRELRGDGPALLDAMATGGSARLGDSRSTTAATFLRQYLTYLRSSPRQGLRPRWCDVYEALEIAIEALSAQPSPGGQGDARAIIEEFIQCATLGRPHGKLIAQAKDYLAARQPVGEPVGWFTEDHLTDRSATTYDRTVADRWRAKGWPVSPLYAAPPAQQPAQVYLDGLDRALGEAIDQRDRYHEIADELAGHIARITGVDIGEHSSANCPWQNAIEAAEEYQPAQAVDLGQALQLDRYDTGLLGDGGGGDVAWWQDYIRAELDRAHDFYQDQADAHG